MIMLNNQDSFFFFKGSHFFLFERYINSNLELKVLYLLPNLSMSQGLMQKIGVGGGLRAYFILLLLVGIFFMRV